MSELKDLTIDQALDKLREAKAILEEMPSIDGGDITVWWSPKMDTFCNEAFGELETFIKIVEEEKKTGEWKQEFKAQLLDPEEGPEMREDLGLNEGWEALFE